MVNTTYLNIVLLVRSYKRSHYLEQTLASLLESDIDICSKRYIYDDGSPEDDKAIQILKDPAFIKRNNNDEQLEQVVHTYSAKLSNYVKKCADAI